MDVPCVPVAPWHTDLPRSQGGPANNREAHFTRGRLSACRCVRAAATSDDPIRAAEAACAFTRCQSSDLQKRRSGVGRSSTRAPDRARPPPDASGKSGQDWAMQRQTEARITIERRALAAA